MFINTKALKIPSGDVVKIESNGIVLWELPSSYTNQVPISIDTDGSIFNDVGYKDAYRLSSSGILKNSTNSTATGYIPAKAGDVIYIAGTIWATSAHSGNYICAYDENFTYIGATYRIGGIYGTQIHDTTELLEENISKVKLLDTVTNIAYIRVSAYGGESESTKMNGKDLIVTINEEIV